MAQSKQLQQLNHNVQTAMHIHRAAFSHKASAETEKWAAQPQFRMTKTYLS